MRTTSTSKLPKDRLFDNEKLKQGTASFSNISSFKKDN